LEQGADVEQVRAGILGSAEYQALVGTPQTSPPKIHPLTLPLGNDSNTVTVNGINGDPITLSAPGFTLADVTVSQIPASAPAGYSFPWGLLGFTIDGVTPGGSAVVTITLPEGRDPTTYMKEDPNTDQFSSFMFDGTTGAVINSNVITLYFVQGGRGDTSQVDDEIVDPGAGGGGSSSVPTVVPLLYDSTDDDPSRELLAEENAQQGRDPGRPARP